MLGSMAPYSYDTTLLEGMAPYHRCNATLSSKAPYCGVTRHRFRPRTLNSIPSSHLPKRGAELTVAATTFPAPTIPRNPFHRRPCLLHGRLTARGAAAGDGRPSRTQRTDERTGGQAALVSRAPRVAEAAPALVTLRHVGRRRHVRSQRERWRRQVQSAD